MAELSFINKYATGYQSLEKSAGIGQKVWEILFGGKTIGGKVINGKTIGGKWDPYYGFKTIGKPYLRETKGDLAGLIRYDPKTNMPMTQPGRNWWQYMKQEATGGKTRADALVPHLSEKWFNRPYTDKEFSNYLLERKKAGLPFDPNTVERPTWTPKPAEFFKMLSPGQRQELANVNRMPAHEYVSKYPGEAAKHYGSKALMGGLFLGFPAYESAKVITSREGPEPAEGTLANLGSIAGTNAGFFTVPGFLGGAFVGGGVGAELGKRLGRMGDIALGNRPLQENALPAPVWNAGMVKVPLTSYSNEQAQQLPRPIVRVGPFQAGYMS